MAKTVTNLSAFEMTSSYKGYSPHNKTSPICTMYFHYNKLDINAKHSENTWYRIGMLCIYQGHCISVVNGFKHGVHTILYI